MWLGHRNAYQLVEEALGRNHITNMIPDLIMKYDNFKI